MLFDSERGLKSPENYPQQCNLIKQELIIARIIDGVQAEMDDSKLESKYVTEKHSEELFTCNKCFEIFEYIELLEVHKTVHKPLGRLKKCPCCKLKFKSSPKYALHLQHHLTTYRQCTFCSKIFLRHQEFICHVAQHKRNGDLTCLYCGKPSKTERLLNIHIRVHTNERPYSCDYCAKTFKQLSALISHKNLIHHLGERHKCSICHGIFATKSSVKRHVRRIHESGTLLHCSVCKKEFPNKDLLRQHKIEHICNEELFRYIEYHNRDHNHVGIDNHESQEKSEKDILEVPQLQSRKFEHNESRLFQHVDSHMMKRYECDKTCGKEFLFTYVGLNEHLQQFHALSPPMCNDRDKSKQYQCKKCKSRFSNIWYYIRHIQNKTCIKWALEAFIPEVRNLRCYFCRKSFSRLYLITKHLMRCHMKQEYPCIFCGSNVVLDSFRKHLMKCHAKERKYFCLGCDATFRTLSGYSEHRNSFKRNLFSHRDQIVTEAIIPSPIKYPSAPVLFSLVSQDRDYKSNTNNITGNIDIDDIVNIPETVSINSDGEAIV